MKERNHYRKCRLKLTFHAFNASIKRNFPLEKLKDMISGGEWLAHIEEEKRICVYKNESKYWSLVIAPRKRCIFIITIFPSNQKEVEMFKSAKRKV